MTSKYFRTDRELTMTDDELKALIASLAIGQRELQEAQKKTDVQIRCLLDIQKEAERKIKKVNDLLPIYDFRDSHVVEKPKTFECGVHDLLNRRGFFEGNTLIPEEEPLVEKACILLVDRLGIVDNRWRPVISRYSQHYVLFHDMNTDKFKTIDELAEIERRKIYAVIDQKKLNSISIPFDIAVHTIMDNDAV